ncbi:hypothetical protein EMIHUDRAFT_226507 [Emiliania huxleyi CCMP1516]|uniref:Acyltransferase n=2 Tax=Emiliania huxleyi TaxID=2903 RepID=A0A0D3KL12_EMIH1|nr:hypothetical protein EMIHUDRAFT_226507 [Emiliania huxleyi CCMP1516]EOD36447.1 hypothetical protein EMIHUDRAFT_226507 [Emiliania huxleyi CCMP1516]|eukprot:XP_005788876.1 hypothetical protein EMIHUDRAFT_226507 [Emiliania huxleyi CCMP1516]
MPPVSRPVRRLRTIEIDELPAGTSSSLSPAARSAAVVGGSTDLIGHTLRGSSRVRGAIAIICVLSILLVGPSLPLALLHALWSGRLHLAAALAAVILASALLPVRESALAARLYLQAAGFLRHGVSFWVERRVRVMDVMQADDGSMWCMHPHGTSVGFGFTLNGAVRFKAILRRHGGAERLAAKRPDLYLPAEAPLLFRLPLGMFGLFRQRSDFGILPGGMEEVALFEFGRERVYLKRRKGFIKYALQHGDERTRSEICQTSGVGTQRRVVGYLLLLAYTFGECDLYRSVGAGKRLRMWLLRRCGFVVPLFYGAWWCPLLPRADVAVHTVVGAPLQLPRIAEPTAEQVTAYHALYVEALTRLFDDHKARFGTNFPIKYG